MVTHSNVILNPSYWPVILCQQTNHLTALEINNSSEFNASRRLTEMSAIYVQPKLSLYSKLRCKTWAFLVTAQSVLFPLIISLMATIRQSCQNINLVTEAFYDSLSSAESHNPCITFPYQ